MYDVDESGSINLRQFVNKIIWLRVLYFEMIWCIYTRKLNNDSKKKFINKLINWESYGKKLL